MLKLRYENRVFGIIIRIGGGDGVVCVLHGETSKGEGEGAKEAREMVGMHEMQEATEVV